MRRDRCAAVARPGRGEYARLTEITRTAQDAFGRCCAPASGGISSLSVREEWRDRGVRRVVGAHPERREDLQLTRARGIFQQDEAATLLWRVADQMRAGGLRHAAAGVAPATEDVLADLDGESVD